MKIENMGLIEHMKELRRRLLWCVGSVIVGAIVVYIFFGPLFSFLEKPYCDFAEETGDGCSFLITDVLEPFSISLTVSGYGGLILALPVILYHFARFVMPALYPKERKVVIPFVFVGVLLFIAGSVGGYFIMPQAVDALLSFNSQDSYDPILKAQTYIGFFIKMVLAFGLAAELPLVLIFLQKIGLLSNKTLRKNRRAAVAIIVVLGAVITPTGDPFMLMIISVPMYVLFELSILIGKSFSNQKDLA